MMRFQNLCFTMVLLSLSLGKGQAYEEIATDGPDSLVRGILARAEAVFSARMNYHYKWQFANRNTPPKERDERASFDGTNWVTRCLTKGQVGERSNYNGKLVIHLGGNRGAKSSMPDWVAVKRPQAIDENDPSEVPYFAGTFWHKMTKNYVKDHALEVKVKGRAELQGVQTVRLEWAIPPDLKEAATAFHGVNDVTNEGGVLRVYVASQLGHVLPLIEMVGKGGIVGHRFEAGDFIETSPGIFIPRRFSHHLYDSEGLVLCEEYIIEHIEKVNEPIPAEDFIIEAPHGSVLVDERPLNESRSYRVGVMLPTDLNDVLPGAVPSPPPMRRRSTAIWLGLTVGVLFVCICYFMRRFLKRPSG